MNILDAVHLLAPSWDQVSTQTIRNCLAHGGFCEKKKKDQKSQKNIEKPLDMTVQEFKSWVDLHQNLPVAFTLTKSKICQIIMGKQANDETDSDKESIDSKPPPTSAEMRNALKVLKRVVLHCSDDFKKHYDHEQFINKLLMKNCRQSTIAFFKLCIQF